MASVDLSEKSFFKYCEIAYLKMFNNEMQQIDKQEFIELICSQNMKISLVEAILQEVDASMNESISF